MMWAALYQQRPAPNTLRRLLLDLGLERRMRDITPTIDAYLKR
jgi:hypothetical protein